MENRINERQKRFAREYVLCGSATEAAKRAGYKPENADVTGPRLLRNVGVRERVAKLRVIGEAAATKTHLDMIRRLEAIAYSDPRKLIKWGPAGITVQDCEGLSEEEAAMMAEAGQTVSAEGGSIRVKAVDRLAAMTLLARLMGWIQDKTRVQIDQPVEVILNRLPSVPFQ